MFKPLLRTIPTLSGNHMIACHINNVKRRDDDADLFDTYISLASFMPLQNNLYHKIINCNLSTGKYEFEIMKYFKYYSNYFYNTNFNFDKNDYQVIDKLTFDRLESRNKDYEFGCKRIQRKENDFQFVFYAPFYIDNVDDIPESFNIKFKFNDTVEKEIIVHLHDTFKTQNYSNPLYRYLQRYILNIDDNVVYCLYDTKQATYFGIDVKRGGFVQITDNVIGTIYERHQTMQNFDFTICEGFSRNNLIMRQIIPLAFTFNIDDILNQREKLYFTNYPVRISGEYYANGRKVDFYDFSSNYVNFKLQSKHYTAFDKYDIVASDNIMDIEYPSLHEGFYHNYKYSNKLTNEYCRWKLKYSDDKTPYITNMSWAFSYVSNKTNNQYGEFPNIYCELPVLNVENTNAQTKYIVDYDKDDAPVYYDKYITALNNNTNSWYTTVSSVSSALNNDEIWCDVKEDTVYYKGILYDLNKYLSTKRNTKLYNNVAQISYIYDDIVSTNEQNNLSQISYEIFNDISSNLSYVVDKFAVLLVPENITETDKNVKYLSVKNSITNAIETNTANSSLIDNKILSYSSVEPSSAHNHKYSLYENDCVFKYVGQLKDIDIDTSNYATSYYYEMTDYLSNNTWYIKDQVSVVNNDYDVSTYVMDGYYKLNHDNTNLFFTEDEITLWFDTNRVDNLYYSEKGSTIKHRVTNTTITNPNITDYDFFIKTTFINSLVVKQESTVNKTRYNFIPACETYDSINTDYFETAPDMPIKLYNENNDVYTGFINQVFIDAYNFDKLCEKYGINGTDFPRVRAYCEPICVDHIIRYFELFNSNVFDENVFYKQTSYINRDEYTKQFTYEKLFDNEDKFKNFAYKLKTEEIKYNNKTKTYEYDNETIKIVLLKEFVALSLDVYNKMVIENDVNDDNKPEPLMLYRVNNDNKIAHSYQDVADDGKTYYDCNSCLTPIVNSIYKSETTVDMYNIINSNKIHERVYNVYNNNLNEIVNVIVYDDYDLYTFINYDVDLASDENTKIYQKINAIDILFNSNINDINADDDVFFDNDANVYIVKHNDLIYMFYLINIKYLCTSHSFAMQNGTLFTSVDNVDYTNDMFDIVAPCLKQSIFNKFAPICTTMLVPISKIVNIHYLPIIYDNGNTINSYKYEYLFNDDSENKNVYDIKFFDTSISKVKFNRYFNNITPLITKTTHVNTYQLKYKAIDMTINDNNIYNVNLNIYEYEPLQCLYKYDNNKHVASEEDIKQFVEYEYKHFNDNLMWNLCVSFTIQHENMYLKYDELLDAETKESTFEYFKKYMKNHTFLDNVDNITMLFLFNRYSVSYISEPMNITNDKNTKLYKLVYKFILN